MTKSWNQNACYLGIILSLHVMALCHLCCKDNFFVILILWSQNNVLLKNNATCVAIGRFGNNTSAEDYFKDKMKGSEPVAVLPWILKCLFREVQFIIVLYTIFFVGSYFVASMLVIFNISFMHYKKRIQKNKLEPNMYEYFLFEINTCNNGYKTCHGICWLILIM